MKLHLGCGERYLAGYENIDFPASEHTVQQKSVADRLTDLRDSRFAAGSIEEVRLHHVFEHFTRPRALALLASWASWLRPDGRVVIEVPNLTATALHAINPLVTRRARYVAIRHLFGSHEAPWAVHCEGWNRETLGNALSTFCLKPGAWQKTRYLNTFNLTVTARLRGTALDRNAAAVAAEHLLRNYMVNDSDTEHRLLRVWMSEFAAQLMRTWAVDA